MEDGIQEGRDIRQLGHETHGWDDAIWDEWYPSWPAETTRRGEWRIRLKGVVSLALGMETKDSELDERNTGRLKDDGDGSARHCIGWIVERWWLCAVFGQSDGRLALFAEEMGEFDGTYLKVRCWLVSGHWSVTSTVR